MSRVLIISLIVGSSISHLACLLAIVRELMAFPIAAHGLSAGLMLSIREENLTYTR
jgi:hypothetical protein